MKIINLKKYKGISVDRQIEALCGSKKSSASKLSFFGDHISGLHYCDPEYGIVTPTHRVSISLFSKGLGIYFRNIENNRLVLIPYEEIVYASVKKNADIIQPYRFSPFSILSKMGFSFSTIKSWLMPKEIMESHPGLCEFGTQEHIFSFIIDKNTPERVIQKLNNSPIGDILQIEIVPFKILK